MLDYQDDIASKIDLVIVKIKVVIYLDWLIISGKLLLRLDDNLIVITFMSIKLEEVQKISKSSLNLRTEAPIEF